MGVIYYGSMTAMNESIMKGGSKWQQWQSHLAGLSDGDDMSGLRDPVPMAALTGQTEQSKPAICRTSHTGAGQKK